MAQEVSGITGLCATWRMLKKCSAVGEGYTSIDREEEGQRVGCEAMAGCDYSTVE